MISTYANDNRWHVPRPAEREAGESLSRMGCRLSHFSGLDKRRHQSEIKKLKKSVAAYSDSSESKLAFELEKYRSIFSRDNGYTCRQEIAEKRAEALALLAVVMERQMGMKPYDVQLKAALAMHQGAVIQLTPGEGKTLALALVSALLGWTGRPCHVVTANDYLAERDAELMSPFYRACGLRAVSVLPGQDTQTLKQGYDSDIVYATGKQLLADFLRDELLLPGVRTPLQRQLRLMRGTMNRMPVMRGLFSAVVDEADSVLIDEANTPLIISGNDSNERLLEAVPQAFQLSGNFKKDEHYTIDYAYLKVIFTEEGYSLLDQFSKDLPPLWRKEERSEELLQQAILARKVFIRDRHYVVIDDKVVIVDENTGRGMPNRSWSYGLHQAIEAKEGVPLSEPSRIMARRSFQDFFRRYHRLCGASGTLQGISGELWDSYDLLTVKIPLRLSNRLSVDPPACFKNSEEKTEALCRRIAVLHKKGLPVLVGTRRISDSETIARLLKAQGLECCVLNAREHKQEAAVIARAGQTGAVTVATNMAGRGVDIKVPGEVNDAGGLQVLMFEPHESSRVDWQLFGRSGRQGAPGRATMFVSIRDDLLQRHLPWLFRWILYIAKFPIIGHTALRLAIWLAQWRAQRLFWWQRKQLVKRNKLLRSQITFADKISD